MDKMKKIIKKTYNLLLDDEVFTLEMWKEFCKWCVDNDIDRQDAIRDALVDFCYDHGITTKFYEEVEKKKIGFKNNKIGE